MHEEDDLRGLAKIADLLRATAFLVLLTHLYWYTYEWFAMQG